MPSGGEDAPFGGEGVAFGGKGDAPLSCVALLPMLVLLLWGDGVMGVSGVPIQSTSSSSEMPPASHVTSANAICNAV
jgi:hypothetical protein